LFLYKYELEKQLGKLHYFALLYLIITDLCLYVYMTGTCVSPVVSSLVWGAVDELAKAGHSMRPNQGVASKCPTVQHPNIEGWME